MLSKPKISLLMFLGQSGQPIYSERRSGISRPVSHRYSADNTASKVPSPSADGTLVLNHKKQGTSLGTFLDVS